jgi:hypothetical protein
MKKLLALLFLLVVVFPATPQPTSCSAEKGIQGRTDIIWCEGFETSTWWQNSQYKGDGRKTSPIAVVASQMAQTSIVSAGCISGNCLRIECRAWNSQSSGCTGALNVQLQLPGGPHQEAFARFYLFLPSTWSAEGKCATSNTSLCPAGLGNHQDTGGKWPGFADTRTQEDPSGQCGNGGNGSDGINCWSARMKYSGCEDDCTGIANPNDPAYTRFGFYWYLPWNLAGGPDNNANTRQAFGPWDHNAGDGETGPCGAISNNLAGGTGTESANSCGKGNAGQVRNKWYRIEIRHRMNTVGSSDGVAEAWITDVASGATTLRYRKTNVLYRLAGHDNLHVRNFWINFHAGGESQGPDVDTFLLMDQLVISTKARAGAFKGAGSNVSQPFDVRVQ